VSGVAPRAFRMTLRPGAADEYRRRHDAIWPEIVALLKASGISDYSIHLDESDGVSLFAVRTETQTGAGGGDDLRENPVMLRWWAYMADLMETGHNAEPISRPLRPMFLLS